MAKILKNFDFDAARQERRTAVSPLDKYLDGQTWEVSRQDWEKLEEEQGYLVGSLYTTVQKMALAFYNRGRRINLRVRTFSKNEDTLIVRAGNHRDD